MIFLSFLFEYDKNKFRLTAQQCEKIVTKTIQQTFYKYNREWDFVIHQQ